MAAQCLNRLTRVGFVHLDGVRRVGIHRSEILATIAEATFPTLLDGNVLVGLHVLHQEIHETQLVRLADNQMEPRGVKGDAVGLLVEPLAQGARLLDVVPDPGRLVNSTGHYQGLPDTNIHAQNGTLATKSNRKDPQGGPTSRLRHKRTLEISSYSDA